MTTTAGRARRGEAVDGDDLALVDAFYAALDDVPALLRLCAADAEFRYPAEGRLAYGGRWQGHDQIVRFLEAHEDQEEILDFAVRDVIGREGRLVALGTFRGRARSTGIIWETDFVHVITARDGRVQRFEAYFDTAAALEAHSA